MKVDRVIGRQMNESVVMGVYSLMALYNEIRVILVALKQVNGGAKNKLGDDIIGPALKEEREKLKKVVEGMPEGVRSKLIPFFSKCGISFSGVQISRNDRVKDLIVMKCFRFVLFMTSNQLQDGTELVLNLLVSGLGSIYSAVMNIKDGGDIFKEVKSIGALCVRVIKKIRG